MSNKPIIVDIPVGHPNIRLVSEPPRRRTVICWGYALLTVDFPWVIHALGIYPTRPVPYWHFVMLGTGPSLHFDTKTKNIFNYAPEGCSVCYGDKAANAIKDGKLDPVEAYWNTVFGTSTLIFREYLKATQATNPKLSVKDMVNGGRD